MSEDRIYIRDLALDCIVGVYPHERLSKQRVVFNLTLSVSLEAASQSDAIADTVNYKELKDRIIEELSDSSYELIESLARRVCEMALACAGVTRVTVSVDKPGALTGARSVAVEITRDA
jgi:dihydroneopterin aldolase